MKIIILLFLISFSARANACEKYNFTLDEKKTEFCLLKEAKILVSKDCTKKKCDAFLVAHNKKIKNINLPASELAGGKNPSTLLCKKLEGKLILGISELSHEEYFCEFSDGSLISTSSLYSKYQE